MLTAALAVLCLLLALTAATFALLWRAAALEIADHARLIRHQLERIQSYRAELDALSIAGPSVDTRTGSHDHLPIQPDIRQMLTDYCEGMWQHTTEDKR